MNVFDANSFNKLSFIRNIRSFSLYTTPTVFVGVRYGNKNRCITAQNKWNFIHHIIAITHINNKIVTEMSASVLFPEGIVCILFCKKHRLVEIIEMIFLLT